MKQVLPPIASMMLAFGIMLLPVHLSAESPSNPVTEVKRANDLLNEYHQNWDPVREAKKILDKVLKRTPSHAPAYRALARYHLMRSERVAKERRSEAHDAAERALNHAISLDPRYADAYLYLGHFYRSIGRLAEAKTALRRAEAIGTENPWLEIYWADIFFDEGNEKEATRRFQRVLESDVKNQRVVKSARQGILRKAAILLNSYSGNQEVLEAAKSDISTVLKTQPENEYAHRLLAQYWERKGFLRNQEYLSGHLEAAEASLKKAIKINPKSRIALVSLGNIYRLMGRLDTAKSALRHAQELGSKSTEFQLEWAELLWAEGKLEDAGQHFKRIAATHRYSGSVPVTALQGLIRYHHSKGNLGDIDKLYRQIIADNQTAWAYGNYATFLLCYTDQYEAAIQNGKKAISLMNYGLARYYLAAALYRKWAAFIDAGDYLSAHKYFQEAQAYYPDVHAIAGDRSCGSLRNVADALYQGRKKSGKSPRSMPPRKGN